MPVKTITIDIEAYKILSRRKRAGQSFSQLIKERLGRRMIGKDLRALVGRARISEKVLDGVDVQVRARRGQRARRVKL